MNPIPLIGFSAAILSIISFLPQVIKCWKTRQTKDISLSTYILFAIALSLWITYGLLNKDLPVILANIIVLILALNIVYLKLKYG